MLDFDELWERLTSVDETRSKGAGTFYIPGARMRQAEGTAYQISAANPTDKALSVESNPTDKPTIPVPVHIAEVVENLGQRASLDEISYVTDIAEILNRNPQYIQERYLRPLPSALLRKAFAGEI